MTLKDGYRLRLRGGSYKLMRIMWYLLSWTSEQRSWDKVTGLDYHEQEIDTYYLIRLWRKS